MPKHGKDYIPALTQDWLTPLFDPVLRFSMRDEVFKQRLVVQAQIGSGQRVLDLGCGTATLTILIKRLQPQAQVIGLDGDPNVLQIARAKIAKAGLDITLDEGMSFALPYPDKSFDRVLSSLVFHHLTKQDKSRTAQEVFRVLKPGGELHIADFGKPHTTLARLMSLFFQRFERVFDNVRGFLPEAFRTAGFVQVEEVNHYMTVFGTLALYRARKPE